MTQPIASNTANHSHLWDAPLDQWSARERQVLEDWSAAGQAMSESDAQACRAANSDGHCDSPAASELDALAAAHAALGAFGAREMRVAAFFARQAAASARAGGPGAVARWNDEASISSGPSMRATHIAWSMAMRAAFDMTSAQTWIDAPEGEAPENFAVFLPIFKLNPNWVRRLPNFLNGLQWRATEDAALRMAQWLAAQENGAEKIDLGSLMFQASEKTRAWLSERGAKFSARALAPLIQNGFPDSPRKRSAAGAPAVSLTRSEEAAELIRSIAPAQLPDYTVDLGLAAVDRDKDRAWKWIQKNFTLNARDALALATAVGMEWGQKMRKAGLFGGFASRPPALAKRDEERADEMRQQLATRLHRVAALCEALAKKGRGVSWAEWSALAEKMADAQPAEMVRWCLAQGASPKGAAEGGGLLMKALQRRDFIFAEELAALDGWGPAAEAWLANHAEKRTLAQKKGVAITKEEAEAWPRWEGEGVARWERRQMQRAIAEEAEKQAGAQQTVENRREEGLSAKKAPEAKKKAQPKKALRI